ncbi:MAG: protein kinase, partial [Planctomycetes bacterium]|nr:protein kinase [Planctomycetota bacterium]
LGEGGMGMVYLAQQEQPFRRRVALKIIKLGMDTRQVIARFESERQALALMNHPHIARVFDAGTTEQGRPYFVMEHVAGISITKYCDQHRLSIQERLQLFTQVCQAIHHAHQKGIIHRDIKPSNALVTLHEGRHIVVVIDFGIAKATSQQLTEKTLFTQYAQMVGTPEYMSPEQAEMSRLDVDTRTDIYSLGVLLYELLTGTTPFDSKTLREAGYARMQQIIRDSEPPKPSTRLSDLGVTLTELASLRRTRPESLCNAVRGDLDWIVMKSMDKDRNLRYETANALSMDIQRHLECEPILARPPSAAYRFQKMVKRNKLVVAASASVVAALVIGLGISVTLFVRERSAYQQLELSKEAESRALEAESEQRQLAETNAHQARLNLYAADIKLASIALEEGHRRHGVDLLNRHRPQSGEDDLRGFEWRYLWGRLKGDEIASFADGHCNALSYSPDGRYLVSSSPNGLRVRDANTLEYITTLPLSAMTLSFSASGATLAVGSAHEVTLYDTNTWQEASLLEAADYPAVFSPDGQWLATNTKPEGRFQLLEARTRDVVATYDTQPGLQVQSRNILNFSRDGRWMVTPAEGVHGTDWIRLWSLADGKEVPIDRFGSFPTSADFSVDGKNLFIGTWDGTLVVWDLQAQQATGVLKNHSAAIWQVKVSPDGRVIASCGADSSIILWDASTRRQLARLPGHTGDIFDLDFSADSRRLASGGVDGTVKIWDVSNLRREPVLELTWDPLGFLDDGRQVVAVRPDATLQIWDFESNRIADFNLPTEYTNELTRSYHGFDFAPDTGMIAIGTTVGAVELWNASTRARIKAWPAHMTHVSAVRFTSDGRKLATGSHAGDITVWDVKTRDQLYQIPSQGSEISCVAFSPDDQYLAYCTGSSVQAYHLSGQLEAIPLEENHGAVTVAFSPDGKLLASSSFDSTARLWEIPSGESKAILRGHLMGVPGVAFAPDGKSVVTGGHDRRMKFWSLATHQELMTLTLDGVHCCHRFSPDGTTLAVSTIMPSGERSIHLYRAPSWTEIAAADVSLDKARE